MKRRAILSSALLCAAGLSGGCVERKLSITSEPTGALVYMNDKEIGRTPIETDFLWYGKYDVQVRMEGYKTIDKPTRLSTPWWQYPPIDLFAEFAPWHPTDRQKLHYVLTTRPASDRPPEDIVNRGVAMGKLMESPDRPMPATAPAAATQPTAAQSAGTQPVTRP